MYGQRRHPGVRSWRWRRGSARSGWPGGWPPSPAAAESARIESARMLSASSCTCACSGAATSMSSAAIQSRGLRRRRCGSAATLGDQPCRARMNSEKSRTPVPVGPFTRLASSRSVYAVPAMSRWAHGNPSTNSRRNQPAEMLPARAAAAVLHVGDVRLVEFAILVPQRQRPRALVGPLARRASPRRSAPRRCRTARSRCGPVPPRWRPVSVAMSMTHDGLSRRAYDSASARMSRPSASVLMISIVLPRWLVTTSPGLIAVPDGMFSVVGIKPDHVHLRLEPAQHLEGAQHRRGPRHVVLHLFHVRRRLDRDAAGVERDALAHQHHRGARGALVAPA